MKSHTMKKAKKKFQDLKKDAIKLVSKARVVTTAEIASSLRVSWNTAEKHLLELALEGKLERLKKAGTNLWMKK